MTLIEIFFYKNHIRWILNDAIQANDLAHSGTITYHNLAEIKHLKNILDDGVEICLIRGTNFLIPFYAVENVYDYTTGVLTGTHKPTSNQDFEDILNDLYNKMTV